MAVQQAFMPVYGSTQTLSVTTTAQLVALLSPQSSNLRFVNNGTGECFVRTYDSASPVAATANDMPIESGQTTTITKPKTHDTISVLGVAATTLRFTAGEGV